MLEVEFSPFRLSEIDWDDDTSLITYGAPPEKLKRSIQAVGLIQQPLLQRKENGLLRIICGSRRLAACRQLQLEPLSCQLLGSAVPLSSCLRLAIYDNLAHRRLNPVERALVLTKMGGHLDDQALMEEFMPLLALEPSRRILERYRLLAQLEPPLLDALAAGRLAERTGFALASLESSDRLSLYQFLIELPLSASIQVELVELVTEIARREGLTAAEVVADENIRRWRCVAATPARQRAREIRRYLQCRRAPRLAGRRQRFAREVRALGLPAEIRLLPPPYFEGPEWRLECIFSSPEQLQKRLEQLRNLAGKAEFRRLMQSRQGEDGGSEE